MALCRWQTEESLAIYARLGEADYTRLLERSLHADISSVSTANLPVLGAHTALMDLHTWLWRPFSVASKNFETITGSS